MFQPGRQQSGRADLAAIFQTPDIFHESTYFGHPKNSLPNGGKMKIPTIRSIARVPTAALMACLFGMPLVAQPTAVPPSPDRGYIGLGWSFPLAVETDSAGVRRAARYSTVVQVDKCSPAERAGFKVGDALKVVDGQDGRIVPLFMVQDKRLPGSVHVVTVQRGEELIELTMTSTEPLREGEKPADRCDSPVAAAM